MPRFLTTFLTTVLVAPLLAASDPVNYLALGDSIAFGFDPTLMPNPPAPPWPKPNQFTGYPETVSQLAGKTEANAACPGETSGSFLNVHLPDNGCNGPAGFKAIIGLHTRYTGSQASYAFTKLVTDRSINLVTLSIGGNDLLLLQEKCATDLPHFTTCVTKNLPTTLAIYGFQLAGILTTIRAAYHGPLIIMKSYAPNADPFFVGAIVALNQVMVAVGTRSSPGCAHGTARRRFVPAGQMRNVGFPL